MPTRLSGIFRAHSEEPPTLGGGGSRGRVGCTLSTRMDGRAEMRVPKRLMADSRRPILLARIKLEIGKRRA